MHFGITNRFKLRFKTWCKIRFS